MIELSSRQQELLAAIVEQYAELASPVGSITFARLFDVSPATIRAEMARLEKLGLIYQPHTSAGRVPTDKGYRYYVNTIGLDFISDDLTRPLTLRAERAIDRRVEHAGEPAQAIRSAVNSLSEITKNIGIGTMGPSIYTRGLEQLFDQPEFSEGQGMRAVGYLIDHLDHWLREAAPTEPLSVFIGKENPIGSNSNCTLVISRFRSPYSDVSHIGVLGSTRQNYRQVMNLVQHTAQSLEESFA
jgi:heat-inducible transcriptional repressor